MPRIGGIIVIAIIVAATIYGINKFTAGGVASLGK